MQINGKQFLLTYPQCSLTKEEVLERLQALAPIKAYTIARELHEDGNPHIHAVISYITKRHTTSPRYFDLDNFHPNIQKLRTITDFTRATAYAKKDGEFLSNFEGETTTKRSALAKAILDAGSITPDLIYNNPEIIFLNHSSITSWLGHLPKKKLQVQPPLTKKRHYWFFGPSNSGKTTKLRELRSHEDENSEIPDNGDYRQWNDQTKLGWADEYKGKLTVQALNKLCDGDTMLNTKGGSTHIYFPRIIICSNFSIKDCYSNISDDLLDTLYNRFIEYDFSNGVPAI